MGSRSAAALLAVAVAAAAASTSGAATTATAKLRLDGELLRPEVALTPEQRSIGLMGRTEAPIDGMLFVFPADTRRGFWMEGTLVPLTVVFFDDRGRRVRRLSMTPCRTRPCPIYRPGTRYRFALELPAGDTRRARVLGPPGSLVRLSGVAR